MSGLVGEGSSGEQVKTGLQSWPPDVPRRGGTGGEVGGACTVGSHVQRVGPGGGSCMVRSNASWVMITSDPSPWTE